MALVGCSFFGTGPWSDKMVSGFFLVGLEVAWGVVFFLSFDTVGFFVLDFREGFVGVGLVGDCLVILELVGLGVGDFIVVFVLSGAVIVTVLAFGVGEAGPSWGVTGNIVPGTGVGMVPEVGFNVWVRSTILTAEAAAATLLARLSFGDFLAVSSPPLFGVTTAAVVFVCLGKRGGRFGLYVSASLHCFLMYLQ